MYVVATAQLMLTQTYEIGFSKKMKCILYLFCTI